MMPRAILSSAAACMLLVLGHAPAFGKTENLAVFSLDYTHAPASSGEGTVTVLLNPQGEWDTVSKPHITWRMRVDASWNWAYAPDIAWHQIEFRPQGYPYIHYTMCDGQPACYEQVWQQAPQEDAFYRTVQVPYASVFPHDGIGADPVGRCHGVRHSLLQEGKALRDVIGNDQVIDGVASSWFWMIKDPHTKVLKQITVPLTILCKGDKTIAEAVDPHPAAAVQDVALPFQVNGADLAIHPGTKVQRACPAELAFVGKIHTSGYGSGSVQYRFEWPDGRRSTLYTAKVEDAAQGLAVSHQVAIPLVAAFAPGGGEGGGTPPGQAAGGFAQTQPPPPPPGGPWAEAVPTAPDKPDIKAEGLPANEHKSDVRLVVVSHGGIRSAPAGYHVVCEPKPRDGIAGPGGMAVPQPTAEPATRGGAARRGGAPAAPQRQPAQPPAQKQPATREAPSREAPSPSPSPDEESRSPRR